MHNVHYSAKIGKNVKIGSYTVIKEDAEIGDNCIIGNNVVIHKDTKIGYNVRIDDNTVLGKLPMKAITSATTEDKTLSPLSIGNECLIGALTVIYRGASLEDKILVADQASIREDVHIGEKTIVGAKVSIENKCNIGKICKLELGSYITAFSDVGDFCFIAPMVSTSNDNYMGRDPERFKHFKGVTIKMGGRVGLNATILPGITINEEGQVAAGALVTRDVPSRKIVVGVPAKVWKDVPTEQLLENQPFYQEFMRNRK